MYRHTFVPYCFWSAYRLFCGSYQPQSLSHAFGTPPPSSFSSQSIIYICRLFSTLYGGWRRETIKQAACIGRRRWKFLTGWIRSVGTALALCARCWNDAVHTDPTARPFTLYAARSCAVLVKPQEALLTTQRSVRVNSPDAARLTSGRRTYKQASILDSLTWGGVVAQW